MNFNEQRVRTAFDELVFQWETDGCFGEEYDDFLEVLHAASPEMSYGICNAIRDALSEELMAEMEFGDMEELVRRLRVEYPEGVPRLQVEYPEDDEEDEEEDEEEETPAQFEARRARIRRALDGVVSPREIRRLIWNTRR